MKPSHMWYENKPQINYSAMCFFEFVSCTLKRYLLVLTSTYIQWTRQFRVIDSSGSPLENTYLFFPNDKVYRYFNCSVIFPNLLAA